jgi:hypothetical protein
MHVPNLSEKGDMSASIGSRVESYLPVERCLAERV